MRGLIGLSRSNGVDVRATILRVIVDQFVANPRPRPDEVTRFGELALHLIDEASPADLAIIANKLADHEATPACVARRLVAFSLPIARPILERSTALTESDRIVILTQGDPDRVMAIARRSDLSLLETIAIDAAYGGQPIPTDEARPATAPMDARLARAFLDGGSLAREQIIARLALDPGDGSALVTPADADMAQAVERAALSRRPGRLALALAQALGLDIGTAEQIAADNQGEALVAAARALDLGRAATERVLLFAHADISTSVERVHALSALYEAMPRTVALGLMRALSGHVRSKPAPRHVGATASDASDRLGARQAASAAARPAARAPVVRGGQRKDQG